MLRAGNIFNDKGIGGHCEILVENRLLKKVLILQTSHTLAMWASGA